jgi:hypothetical protein
VGADYAGWRGLSNLGRHGTNGGMVNRGDIIWLGVASGVTGGLTGGLMLGIGMAMMIEGAYAGLLLICIGAPASGLVGWLMARRLAKQL